MNYVRNPFHKWAGVAADLTLQEEMARKVRAEDLSPLESDELDRLRGEWEEAIIEIRQLIAQDECDGIVKRLMYVRGKYFKSAESPCGNWRIVGNDLYHGDKLVMRHNVPIYPGWDGSHSLPIDGKLLDRGGDVKLTSNGPSIGEWTLTEEDGYTLKLFDVQLDDGKDAGTDVKLKYLGLNVEYFTPQALTKELAVILCVEDKNFIGKPGYAVKLAGAFGVFWMEKGVFDALALDLGAEDLSGEPMLVTSLLNLAYSQRQLGVNQAVIDDMIRNLMLYCSSQKPYKSGGRETIYDLKVERVLSKAKDTKSVLAFTLDDNSYLTDGTRLLKVATKWGEKNRIVKLTLPLLHRVVKSADCYPLGEQNFDKQVENSIVE